MVDVLKPAQVAARNHQAKCIGCHAAPDGEAVAFTVGPRGYTASFAEIAEPNVGEIPSSVSAPALTAATALRGVPAFCKAHWQAGDRTVLLSDTGAIHWRAATVRDRAGGHGQTLTDYPALYLWNQPADEDNYTPDWEELLIPAVPETPK